MSKPKWRPATAAEATSNVAAFIEFARATGVADLTPAQIPAFQAENPAKFHALLAGFAGLDLASGLAPQLARVTSNAAMRDRASWDLVLDSFFYYLLEEELRPNDVLVWKGEPDDPAMLGAQLTGATVIFP